MCLSTCARTYSSACKCKLIFTCVEHWAIIKSVNLWLEQSLIKEKNESPDDDIHVSRERNCPLGHFPCLGKLSLSLISIQKDCLISLRSIRHHSFFSTIAESESSSRGMKSSSSFAFSPWTHVCHHGGTIILHYQSLFRPLCDNSPFAPWHQIFAIL